MKIFQIKFVCFFCLKKANLAISGWAAENGGKDCSRYLKVVCPIYYVEEAKADRKKDPEIKIHSGKIILRISNFPQF